MLGISKAFSEAIKPSEHATRTWCTSDARELTVVQDGKAGIKVLTIPLDAVRRALT